MTGVPVFGNRPGRDADSDSSIDFQPYGLRWA